MTKARWASANLQRVGTRTKPTNNPKIFAITTIQVRAKDLDKLNVYPLVIKIKERWREVLDVWGDESHPEYVFGEGSADVEMLNREAVDWASPIWVMIRLVNEDKCTPDEIEDEYVRVFVNDLVEVQIPS